MLTGSARPNFQNFRCFSVSGLNDWKVDKSKPTRKLKHANSMLEYFEYFCQMSSKSILIILSYTVSNLAHFFWDTVYMAFSISASNIHKLQRCANMAARLILQQSFTPSAQYLLEWLSISTWVDFKITIHFWQRRSDNQLLKRRLKSYCNAPFWSFGLPQLTGW